MCKGKRSKLNTGGALNFPVQSLLKQHVVKVQYETTLIPNRIITADWANQINNQLIFKNSESYWLVTAILKIFRKYLMRTLSLGER